MATVKQIPDKARSAFSLWLERRRRHIPDGSYSVLLVVILLLAALSSLDFSPNVPLVVAGEPAPTDIIADRSLLFEDQESTRERRAQVRRLQPMVCDLDLDAVDRLYTKVQDTFLAINQAQTSEEKEQVLRVLLGSTAGADDLTLADINALSSTQVQNAVLEQALPMVQKLLREGVLEDLRAVFSHKGGIVVRNAESGEETLFPELQGVQDLKSVETQLTGAVKALSITSPGRRAILRLFTVLTPPSLTPNLEVTEQRAQALEQAVVPVQHRIQRGELLVRRGERVTHEQQLKVLALWKRKADRFDSSRFLGASVCGLLLSTGLLFSPSGKPAGSLSRRDYVFIAVLLALFALLAKGIDIMAMQMAAASTGFSAESAAFAVPVAGAAAIASLIFSTRRYLVTGLLLAFFCTLMTRGNLGYFLFYFLSAMWSTWLTVRTQSRQDVVWSLPPLLGGLLAMWVGATFLYGGIHTRYLFEALAVAGSAVVSMLLTFALAPVVEMVFGYTTRFRLMELLNLEQPLLRDLMLNAPGTYHHSLIVSNMVEAGAKEVGANALLCKVAALYHDIGKTNKAGYFIENQISDENPHNRLTPSMSALVLISHTKQGMEMAEQHHLGKEVTDIIRQHHGTGLIRYFYEKAKQQAEGPPPKIEDFSYPGPKPQSREAAIVMLGDAVEASSRTLKDPSPMLLRRHIDTIIKGIYADGQLDDADLTFKDLTSLAESFHRMLRGIFHHRIAYPVRTDKRSDQGAAAVEDPATLSDKTPHSSLPQ